MKKKRRRDESPHRAPLRRPCKAQRRRYANSLKDPDFELLNTQHKLLSSEQVLDLSNIYNLNKEHLTSLKDLLPKLQSLNLECCHTLTDADFATLVGFEQIADSNSEVLEAEDDATTLTLESLNLTRTRIGDVGIGAIVMRCKNLKYLYLGHTLITDVSLSLIARYCPKLRVLNVEGCNIGNYGLQLVAQECKSNLETLVINDCTRVNDAIVPYLGFHCSQLRHFEIRNTKIPSRSLGLLIQKLRLTDLNIEGQQITNTQLERIALQQQQTLKALQISYCYNITTDGISRLIETCKNLVEVHMYGLSLEEAFVSSLMRDGLKLYW